MDSGRVKQTVRKFRKEFAIKEVTPAVLEEVFEKQGFTVIEFNSVVNDPDVTTVIRSLGLSEMTARSNGFLYVDRSYRLVFVNDKLSEKERLLVLAHEEGHYYCGHTSRSPVVGRSVEEEYEANEFAHFLLKNTIPDKGRAFVRRHWKPFAAGGAALVLAAGGGFAARKAHDRSLYEGEFYVTETGEKYHLKNCVTIEGSEVRRLTKEDVLSGNYEPCSVCQPQQSHEK